ncbi:hypothetical protein AFLA_005379 [Aspergillus flavus NRRL3357]|nr:hypothetical protein AFLA_005379 [Aspergillus flavus NRRL3357]
MATSERGKLFVSSGVEINHPAVGVSEPRRPVDDFEVEDNRVVQEGPTADADSFPDGGYRSWLVVLGSFLLLMSSYGLMNSVGVLQSYLESHQLANYSSQNVGWISGLFVFVSLGLGVFVGPLFDTYGPRELVSAGSAFYVLSLFLTAECTQYWHFIVCFGIMAGIGGAFTSTIGMSCVPHWFQARAGMAIGTAMAGAVGNAHPGIGDPRAVRTRLIPRQVSPPQRQLKRHRYLSSDSRSHVSFAFHARIGGVALIGLFPTYVTKQGFNTSASVYTLVVLNVCSCIGRLIAGRIADRYGRLNVLIILIFSAVLTMFAILYPFSGHLSALYVFSALYGLCSGSFISLAPVCIRQVSNAKEIGMRFGTCYCLVSFATLICIPIGGEMLEKVGSRIVVIWLGCVLLFSMFLFMTARWACLDYKWHWRIRI